MQTRLRQGLGGKYPDQTITAKKGQSKLVFTMNAIRWSVKIKHLQQYMLSNIFDSLHPINIIQSIKLNWSYAREDQDEMRF